MMRYLLLLLTVPSLAYAVPNSDSIIPLWETTPPNHQSSDLQEQSNRNETLRWVFQVQSPTLEIRLPARGNAVGKAVIICPGGGYGGLAYDWEGTDIASWLNANGIAALILKYRLPEDESNETPHLSPLLDAKRAIRMARHNAAEWGFEPDQIGIMGFSAGGHLASTLGTHFDSGDGEATDPLERLSSRPDFMILIYPVISMQDGVTHNGSRMNLLGSEPSRELIERYSNELQITPETPPTFLLHSSDDNAVPVQNSLLFYEALLANNVETEMHLYPYGGHGFSLAIGRGRLQGWTERCMQWINELEF